MRVRVSLRVDYAVRALLEMTAAPDEMVKLDQIVRAQAIPPRFLEHILTDLRRSGLIASQRGADGGYRLARRATAITVADVIRAVEGPLADVGDQAPEEVSYPAPATALRDVWVAMRASMRKVLEHVTLAQIASGDLPRSVTRLLEPEDAWARR